MTLDVVPAAQDRALFDCHGGPVASLPGDLAGDEGQQRWQVVHRGVEAVGLDPARCTGYAPPGLRIGQPHACFITQPVLVRGFFVIALPLERQSPFERAVVKDPGLDLHHEHRPATGRGHQQQQKAGTEAL